MNFHDLAVKVALGEATHAETLRFSELQKLGREKLARRPGEVVAEKRRRQTAAEMLVRFAGMKGGTP